MLQSSSPSGPYVESKKLFQKFILSVWVIISFYSLFYILMGAYFSAAPVVIGAILLTPITLLLEKKSFHTSARVLFLLSCNFYIYVSSLGFGHTINTEYYSIPALMLSLLVNEVEDTRTMLFGACLPIITWLLTNFLGTSLIPENLIFIPPYKNFFIMINFVGSFGLASVFLTFFLRTIKIQRMKMIASAKMSSLGEMAGGIAHEINNPLTIISGKVNKIRLQVVSEKIEMEKIISDLDRIESTSKRIAKIVKGLRTFSRESEKDPFILVPAREILEETLELCRERIKNYKIELKINCPEDIQINCRPIQISQVLMNLIGNAIDAVEPLTEKWIAIDFYKKGDLVQMSVTDSGTGIPSKVVEKMMNPFFTTKDVGKGTGLGLSISKSILEDHKASITYDKLSKNTRFLVSFENQKTS